MNPVQHDQCFGRRLARTGAASLVITRSTDRVPTPNERALFWRWRSGNPGLGNVVFRRNPVPDCPQPESPFKPIEYIGRTAAADAARSAPPGAAFPPPAASARGPSAADNPIQPEEAA